MPACRNNRHFVFYLQVGRMAITDYNDTPAFYKFIPARVMDDYVRYLRHPEAGMTTEDTKLEENANNIAVLNELSGFMRQLTTDLDENDSELDMEVAEIFNTNSELKLEYCQSPKKPWIPQITDNITATEDRRILGLNDSIIQQIIPKIVTPSSSNSYCYQIAPENPVDMNSNFIQQISPVSPSPGNSPYNQTSLVTSSSTIRSSRSTESAKENPPYPEPHADLTSHHNTFPGSETDAPGKKRPSMEELRRMVLDKSADRPNIDRFTQTEEEQFVEILEDFLEENKDLPPEIKDNILDMLTKTRETVAEQKEGILYTAEIYKGDSDDKPSMDELDSLRAADDEVMEIFNALQLPDLQTELPDLPPAVNSESPKDLFLDMETNMEEFDRAADDEVLDLINDIELPDLSVAVTNESTNDVLLDMATNMPASMPDPIIGSLYSTDVFIGANDEHLLAEFERVVNDELIFEDTKLAELPGPSVHNINEYSTSKFKAIDCVEVEMDSTGQKIYDEIAAFFGCK